MSDHLGRIQVQGNDLPGDGLSWAWTRGRPPGAGEAVGQLIALRGRLEPRQLACRDRAFADAARWIWNVREQGGVSAPVIRTFQNRGGERVQRTARVDVEVLSGTAFGHDILCS